MKHTGPGPGTGGVGRCIVLGYDGDESSRHAASWAANRLILGGKLVIVHACRPLHTPPSPLSTAAERATTGQAIIDELLLDGDDVLLDIDLETEVSDQDPATALIDTARQYHAEAIIIGSKPHSPLHKALGTVSSELHDNSPIPIIVIPPEATPPHPNH